MPSFTGKTFSNFYKNLLGINQSNNTGVDTTTRNIHDGAGNSTAISLSDDEFNVRPINDDTVRTFSVKTTSASNILTVDTTNSKVLIGASQVAANTQYAYFGISSTAAFSTTAGVHYAVPFANLQEYTEIALGNGADPATTYDVQIHNTGDDLTMALWYIPDNITVDAVYWFSGGSGGSGDVINIHLMSYDIDQDSGSTGGNLSGGVVVAGGADKTSLGYENIIYETIAPSTADVDAGKVILAAFESAGTNSDYAVNITVKYHIR